MKTWISALTIALAGLALAACSQDQQAAAPAQDEGPSTAVSIDTGEGSFAFKESDGGDQTSVKIDADEE